MLTNIINVIGLHHSNYELDYLNSKNKLCSFSEFSQYDSLIISLLSRSDCKGNRNIIKPWNFMGGKILVWVIGEIYKCDWLSFDIGKKNQAEETLVASLVDAIYVQKNWKKLINLDGQFLIVIFDQQEDEVFIVNDRFGGIPFYYSSTGKEFIFSTSLNAIATLPAFDYHPDVEAIRESVSFGGFRLGDRTTVENVKMLPWSSVLRWKNGEIGVNRYWNPQDTRRDDLHLSKVSDLIDEGHLLWQSAIYRRLVGLSKPGQTLSGGLDSRAILAEVHNKVSEWTSISFGVPRCDDVTYAFQASQVTGIRWLFHPLYYGFSEDWIEKRSQYIWESDGMVDFSNLLHWETIPLQKLFMDGHISGFLGDAVCGGSLDHVQTINDFINRLPYYSTSIGFTKNEAIQRVSAIIDKHSAWDMKYLFYEAKVAQQTNLLFQAPFSHMRVKKPFVDYALFDFFESLPNQTRTFLYPAMLRSKYPALFKNIPNQKTGMPVMTPNYLVNAERARRLSYRKTQPFFKKLGFPSEPRVRNFLDDHRATSISKSKRLLIEVLLRQDSLVSEIFGRDKLSTFVNSWFDYASVPSNAIGALFSFELYHEEILRQRNS
jgi:asparagine synthase (glutamine-hydrolysing)